MPYTDFQVIADYMPAAPGWLCAAAEVVVKDREVVTLVLALAALLMALRYRQALASVPGIHWWLAALIARMVSWTASIMESFIWPEACNLVEHVLLTTGTLLIAIGCWRTYRSTPKERSA